MQINRCDNLTIEEKFAVVRLWNQEYPKDLSLAGVDAFDEYLEKLADRHHFLVSDEDRIVGWLVDFIRDGHRCFAMLLDPAVQGKGIGSSLLKEAKKFNGELVGWVINSDEHLKADGSTYRSPIGFYEKQGFKVDRDVVTVKSGIRGIQLRWSLNG